VQEQHAAATQQPLVQQKEQQKDKQGQQQQEQQLNKEQQQDKQGQHKEQQQDKQQQQQQQHERAPGEGHVDWSSVAGMPVLVYRAAYTAALCSPTGVEQDHAGTVPQVADSSSCSSITATTISGSSSSSSSSYKGAVPSHSQGMPGLQLLGLEEPGQLLALQHPGTGGLVLGTGQMLAAASGGAQHQAAAAGGGAGAPVYQVTSWQAQWVGNLGGMWSEYYKAHERAPDNVELAPWVAQRYKKYRKRFAAAASGVPAAAASSRSKTSA
jgi:hypothetical protein